MVEFPSDLVRLQQELLRAEQLYQRRVEAVYGHPVMQRARREGRLVEESAELRAAAKVA